MTVSSDPSPPPLRVGQQCRVQIEDVAFGGEGIARVSGFVVMVPFVIEGEEAEVQITEVKRQFARARLLRLSRPSPRRVAPRCPYYGACGGCQYQHMAYEEQLRVKHGQVISLLRRIGGFKEPPVEPVVPCPQPYGYRNRLMLRTQWDKTKRELVLGFLGRDNRRVVNIEQCPLAGKEINDQIRQLRLNGPARSGQKFVLRTLPAGWDVPADSFFQNNPILLPRLTEALRDQIDSAVIRYLIDAYCGVGFFSTGMADLVERYVGVEVDERAIHAARRNAAAKGRTNGDFVVGQTEAWLPHLLERFDAKQTGVILDPPRTGCAPEVLQALARHRPAQILYISCHPATLGRDLNTLCTGAVYRCIRVTPLDMFPQTQHVECIADLRARLEGG